MKNIDTIELDQVTGGANVFTTMWNGANKRSKEVDRDVSSRLGNGPVGRAAGGILGLAIGGTFGAGEGLFKQLGFTK